MPISHLNELFLYLLTGRERGHSACGVELARHFDIVSGKIYPCADLPGSMSIGEIGPDNKLCFKECDLQQLVEYQSLLGCKACGVYNYCGGRCPVQAVAGAPERTIQYCQLMRLHVGLVKNRLTKIKSSMEKTGLSINDI